MVGWLMRGQYLENCNCLPSCPRDAIGVPAPNRFREGVSAMRIVEGHYDDLRLDDLRWVTVVHWPDAIHEGNGVAEIFVDERASQEQRGIVCMPDGCEHKEMEVAQTAVLRSHGAIRFDWQGTHNSLAEVTHTHQGRQA